MKVGWAINQKGQIFHEGKMIGQIQKDDGRWARTDRERDHFTVRGVEVEGVETYEQETSLGVDVQSYPTTIYSTNIGITSADVKFGSMDEYLAAEPPSSSRTFDTPARRKAIEELKPKLSPTEIDPALQIRKKKGKK